VQSYAIICPISWLFNFITKIFHSFTVTVEISKSKLLENFHQKDKQQRAIKALKDQNDIPYKMQQF